MKKPKKPALKPIKAWALVDPETMQILPHRVYDKIAGNGGRGSVTEGWKRVRVEIRPIVRS